MRMSLRVGAQLGGREKGFIRADTASYSCSTSSRLTKDATSTFWKEPLPSLNRRFINIGGREKGLWVIGTPEAGSPRPRLLRGNNAATPHSNGKHHYA